MIKIPKNIEELKSYSPGKSITEYQQEFGFTQTAILWNNENNLGFSPQVELEVQKALSTSNLYPDPLSSKLRSAIAKFNGVQVENVAVENGSEAILNNCFNAFFGEGEHLLTSEGTFVAIYIWAKSNNVEVKKVPLTNEYSFDLNAIEQAITPKTKAVYLANPNNPTGTIFTNSELEDFLAKVPESVMVIVDEAYCEYASALSRNYPNSVLYNRSNVLTLRTFSKAYGIAAIRLGYAIGPAYLIEALNKVRLTFAPGNLTQAAGIGALSDQQFIQKSVALNTKALQQFEQLFEAHSIRFAKSYGNFVLIDVETPQRAEALTLALLKQGIFVRHLRAFGLPSCIRISTGSEAENTYFYEQFPKIVSETSA